MTLGDGCKIKYGVIDYSRGYGRPVSQENGVRYFNVGDDMQSLAILNLYKRLGIPDHQIVWIAHDELKIYCGDYVVLPMNMFGTKGDIFPLSPYIVPLFFGFNYVSGKVWEYSDLFRNHEPIGCRDEYTLRVMRDAGIEAYLTGCLTITLPRREQPRHASKIFIVDAPRELDDYIPGELRRHVEYLTHEVEMSFGGVECGDGGATRIYAEHLLSRYRDEAALVITGRLHCASPCVALGIPVIIAKENVESNLSWIDKFIKIYGVDDFEYIDWHPESLQLEDFKEYVFSIFRERLEDVVRKRVSWASLSGFYEKRVKSPYSNGLERQLCDNVSNIENKPLRYVIWGAGAGGTLAHMLIREKFPRSHLVGVVDTFETGSFFGLPIKRPSDLEAINYNFVFVCTYSGRNDAEQRLSELGHIKGLEWMHLVARTVNSRAEVREAAKSKLMQIP